jgi:hypothetical protein
VLGSPVTTHTDANGNYKVSYGKPAKDETYLVSFAATGSDSAYKPASASVRSLVAALLRIDHVTASSTSHTVPVKFSGHIAPSQTGRYVYLFARPYPSGRYITLGKAKVASNGTWTLSKTLARGKWFVYAHWYTQNGNYAANSNSVIFSRS